jgi:hypothetical protein
MGVLMTILVAALLALQAQDAPAFRATMTFERYAKREDRVSVDTGDLFVRPGQALVYQSRTQKIAIRDGKAIERHGAERKVVAWDLSKPENFQPLDLWRLTPRAILELFREIVDRTAEPRELPPAVLDGEGKPRPPVAVNPSPESLARTDGVDRAEGCSRVILVPRDPRLRARIASIRLSVDRATNRILRAVVDSPAHVLTLTIGDCPEAAPLEDAVFDWDISNLKVEDR